MATCQLTGCGGPPFVRRIIGAVAAALRVIGSPAVLIRGTEVPEIDRMIGDATDAQDLPIFRSDIMTATVGAQNTHRMHAGIGFAFGASIRGFMGTPVYSQGLGVLWCSPETYFNPREDFEWKRRGTRACHRLST